MNSIKTKFILSFSIIILTITVIIGLIVLTSGQKSLRESATNSLQLLASEGAKIVESRMDEVTAALTIISKKSEIENMGWEVDTEVLKEELKKINFIDIGYVLPNGYTYYTDGTIRLMSDRSYITNALEGKSEISDVIISRVTRKPEIEVAVPVYKDGEVVGALVGRKEAEAFSDIITDIGYGEKGYAFMINEVGTIIAHPDNDKVINRVNPINIALEDKIEESLAEALQIMLMSENGVVEYEYDKSNFYAGYSLITDTNWRIVIAADESEIMAMIPKMLYTIAIAFIIIFICSLGVVFVLDSKLTQPIIKLSKHSKQLGELDISKNVETAYLMQKDEIGTLSNAFQVLTVNLRNIITELSETAIQVLDTAQKLTETTKQSAEASDDITITMEGIAKSAYEQAKNTETGLVHAGMLEKKININNSHMLNLNNVTVQILNLVDEGLVVINKLTRLTDENDAATKKICKVIYDMQKSSEQISKASKLISDIARDTNLLSFNASIEAARAGEAGRGFTVVAGEIQNLAEQSASSTKDIDCIIAQLHNSMQETIDSMNRMTATSEEQNKGITETICKYKEISEAIKNSEKAVDELNDSEKEMKKVNYEIKNMLQALSSIAEQNSASAQQSVSVMEEQNASIQVIADVSNRLTQLALNLKTTVANFKL